MSSIQYCVFTVHGYCSALSKYSTKVSNVMINPCSRWLWVWEGLSGVWAGAGTYRSTNLLLRDVIDLYPDLLLGRRGVMIRNENGGWRTGRPADSMVKWYFCTQLSNKSLLLIVIGQPHLPCIYWLVTKSLLKELNCWESLHPTTNVRYYAESWRPEREVYV